MKLKKIIIYIFILVFYPLVGYSQSTTRPKPAKQLAACYCDILGYKVEIRKDKEGNERGFCIFPDGSAVDIYDFFRGSVGEKWSYGYKHGYHVYSKRASINGNTITFANCVKYDSLNNIIEEIPEIFLLKRNKEENFEDIDESEFIFDSDSTKKEIKGAYNNFQPQFNFRNSDFLPDYWDWRHYSTDNHSYIGPVKNQGSCGSCYAFGTCAAAESAYNFNNHLFNEQCVDFSEAYIMWALGKYGPYANSFQGCTGASQLDYDEMDALRVVGITEESNMPYNNGEDPGYCNAYLYPRHSFQNWYRVGCSDYDGIRYAIYTYGGVQAHLWATLSFQLWKNGDGIYHFPDIGCDYSNPCYYTPTNHAVSLIGWGTDDKYGDYWILRNSYGASWAEGGYMRIAVGSAYISCEVAYFEDSPAIYPPLCGDGFCSPGENYFNCSNDCPNPGGGSSACCSFDCGWALNYDYSSLVEICPDEPIYLEDLGSYQCYPMVDKYIFMYECDASFNQIGPRYEKYLGDEHTPSVFRIRSLALELGLNIQNGHYYKVIPSKRYNSPSNQWVDWPIIFYMLTEDYAVTSVNIQKFDAADEKIFAVDELSTSGTLNLPTDRFITFKAGTSVNLNMGFNAGVNSNFSAYFTPDVCNPVNKKNTNAGSVANTDKIKKDKVIQEEDININIYPNPNNGAFTVKSPIHNLNNEECVFETYDVLGNKTYSKNINCGENLINLESKGTNGVLFYSVKYKGNIIAQGKVIIIN